MPEITKQIKKLSNSQNGVSLIKEDMEILGAKLGSIVKINLESENIKKDNQK